MAKTFTGRYVRFHFHSIAEDCAKMVRVPLEKFQVFEYKLLAGITAKRFSSIRDLFSLQIR